MRRNAILLRNLNRKKRLLSPSINEALINSFSNTTTAAVLNSNSLVSLKTFFSSTATFTASTIAEFELPPHFSLRRSLCSSSSGISLSLSQLAVAMYFCCGDVGFMFLIDTPPVNQSEGRPSSFIFPANLLIKLLLL